MEGSYIPQRPGTASGKPGMRARFLASALTAASGLATCLRHIALSAGSKRLSTPGRRNRRSIWMVSIASAAVAAVLVVAPSPKAEAGTVAPNITYAALGDSYSSGEGNPPFLAGTDGIPFINQDWCHRSPAAYPFVIQAAYGTANPMFWACSGAFTNPNFVGGTWYTEGPQINEAGVTSANLITSTIGGNDAGFSPTLQACISQTIRVRAYNAFVSTIGKWLGFSQSDPSCANSSAFTSSVDAQIADAGNAVLNAYTTLKSSLTSPSNTSIIAADYPHLFPPSTEPSAQTCIQLSPYLTQADQNWMNSEADNLDSLLINDASTAGINMVDVRQVFTGHAICDSGGAWINSLSDDSGVIPNGPVGSFHPNALGHFNGYAAAIENYINNAVVLTPQGLPADPAPGITTAAPMNAASTSSTVGADTITSLAVAPVSAAYPGCEGLVRGGENVRVTGGGFAPSAAVTIYSTSAGQASPEMQIGSVTADSAGNINTVVQIPLGATGFRQSGTGNGVIAIDAIGIGADGASHHDAVGNVGAASPRSICGGASPLAGGEAHTLVVNSDNTVSAMGFNGYGQLGNGTTTSSTTPVKVSGLSGVSEVTAGDTSSYALTSSGSVYAWGDNTYGQLGNGTTTRITTPAQLTGLSNLMQIAAGNDHVLALKPDGTVVAWGLNNAGQLGNTTSAYSTTPVAVPGLSNMVQVAAGGLPGWAGHSVALKNNGTVWTWGYGKHGQLGLGSNTSNPTPTQVPGLTGIIAIAADGDNTYALKSNGTVYAWGDDGYGQIGNTSSANNQNTPLQSNISDVTAIAADGTAAFAIKTNGTVWAWGDNNTGQLGDNAACGKYCVTPVQAIGLTNTGSIAGGYVHSLAETINGNIYGWGSNSYGQLGNGTTTVATKPTLTPGITAEH
jgi:alpha-tubulin suppressor-like RCC1 family protein